MSELSKATVIWQALKDAAGTEPQGRGYMYMGQGHQLQGNGRKPQTGSRPACSSLVLKKGDRIAIIGLNQPEWLYAYFGAAKIGAVVVGSQCPVPGDGAGIYPQPEPDSGRAYAGRPGRYDELCRFLWLFPAQNSHGQGIHIHRRAGVFPVVIRFDELLKTEVDRAALDQAQAAVTPEDLMIIIYTSGTTGLPKGAAITHRSQLASARAQAEHTKAGPTDLTQLSLPFNHVGGITCGHSGHAAGPGHLRS